MGQMTGAEKAALAAALAIGYPGFSYLRERRPVKRPVELLLSALDSNDLEALF